MNDFVRRGLDRRNEPILLALDLDGFIEDNVPRLTAALRFKIGFLDLMVNGRFCTSNANH
jgi:hypothetical protein